MLYDIGIVGGGLSGLLASCLLARRGLSVLLMERKDLYGDRQSLHTTAIAYSNIALLHDLGLWDTASQQAGRIDTIAVSSRSDENTLFLTSDEIGIEAMGYVMYNRYFVQAMVDKLCNLTGVTMLDNVAEMQIDDQVNEVHRFSINLGKHGLFRSKAIFVADGANSALAEKFAFRCYGHDYQQLALVFNVRHDNPHMNVAAEKFMPYGPLATLPLQDPYHSAVVWTQHKDMALDLRARDNAFLHEVMRNHIPDWLGKTDVISKPQYHPLKLLMRYPAVRDGIYLIGSSLRSIHPLAGQAFNVIMRDLVLLCSAGVMDQNCHMINKKKYFMQLGKDGLAMAAVTHLINSVFSANGFSLIRDLGLMTMRNIDPLRKLMIRRAVGSC